MAFNSVNFFFFFLIVYLSYLLLQKRLRLQNFLLLFSSCFFYGCWDWRFLFLMFATIVIDFFAARAIYKAKDTQKRKLFLGFSIVSNLGILAFFKYFNFFISSVNELSNLLGFALDANFIAIILPVGISFYTFQSMSYVIDVYRSELKPAESLIDYATYVSYFPQLVAGPIERGTHLLPQMLNSRVIKLDQFYQGCYLVFWGLFKKVVIADNLAKIVDPVFTESVEYQGSTVLLALYAFAFQIYCDFSGYSDIARGLGKCMGFDIMLNFKTPYFSTSPSEFWRRWHISLSTWLKDYLYIPLGGNRGSESRTLVNMLIVMLLGGLWHGASWNFVIWGAYHGFLLVAYRLAKQLLKLPIFSNRFLEAGFWLLKLVIFFHLTCLGWLFFRAESYTQIISMLKSLFLNFELAAIYSFDEVAIPVLIFTLFLIVIQCFQYFKDDLMIVFRSSLAVQSVVYFTCLVLLFVYGSSGATEFIYFQF
ncbi:UNVERIFIED_CONTAM: hypothetical protein GTU68_054735 [Idotea baltica]|nr:hypothetical protein [Idotea baltica]